MKRRRLRLVSCGILALVPRSAAWFSSDSSDGKQEEQPQPHGPPGVQFAFGGVPVIMVDNHRGHDPWEDLHKNMERVLKGSVENKPALPAIFGSGGAPPMMLGGPMMMGGPMMLGGPLQLQLGNIFQLFGNDHAGHFGSAQGSFQVDDDHQTRIRITATLPGYKLGADANGPAAQSPLSVRTLGRRSLVVSGTHQQGPLIHSWQRSFSLPKGCDLEHIEVTYSSTSGNLTVEVPRLNLTAEELAVAEEPEEPDDLMDQLLPPALRAMRNAVPQIVGQMQPQAPKGFLRPQLSLEDLLNGAMGTMAKAHPRFHPPPGGEHPIPEDAEVSLVGCFAESQLAQVELKYYGDSNAASFSAMYWHAHGDHVPYFAMARHQEDLGHAFTAKGFVHSDEKPQWGVYDGCGSRCADDPNRWCGCANEASRGFPNGECLPDEKRFAVYKIGKAAAEPAADAEASQAPKAAPGRPYWQLSNDDAGGAPSIEIVVPPGTVAKPQGNQVLLFNSTEPAAEGARRASAEDQPGSTPSSSQEETASKPAAEQGSPATEATPVGKVRLPVGVDPDSCEFENSKQSEGGKVLKCKLDDKDIRNLPIRVLDEL